MTFMNCPSCGAAMESLTLGGRLGIEVPGRHSALGDALATGAVFVRQLDLLEARGIVSLESLLKASNITLELRARQAQF